MWELTHLTNIRKWTTLLYTSYSSPFLSQSHLSLHLLHHRLKWLSYPCTRILLKIQWWKNYRAHPPGVDAVRMWEKILAQPGEEKWRNCSLVNANSDVLSNLLLNSMKSLCVHKLISQNPHQTPILVNKNSGEILEYLECSCCLNYTPGFLVFKTSLYTIMESLKNGKKCISITAYILSPGMKYVRDNYVSSL